MEDNISYDYITRYIRELSGHKDEFLLKLEEFAKKNDVPIAQRESIRFLKLLASIKKPSSILEVGTAIGYSAIILSETLKENGHITSIEKDETLFNRAVSNIKECNLENKITVLHGDATDVLPTLTAQFDFIFLDAAKAQYLNFLPHIKRLLKKDGILISDNVLYQGMTATDELVIRRKITIVKRLRQYLAELSNSESFLTSVIPIGDGMAISMKK